jgi:hypothetical protein
MIHRNRPFPIEKPMHRGKPHAPICSNSLQFQQAPNRKLKFSISNRPSLSQKGRTTKANKDFTKAHEVNVVDNQIFLRLRVLLRAPSRLILTLWGQPPGG